jgi:hypothetical protein
LQIRAILRLDFGHSLRDGAAHVGDDQHDEDPVQDARGGIAPTAVLKDVERPFSNSSVGCNSDQALIIPRDRTERARASECSAKTVSE